ncbi:hypothetical protein MLD38_013307 [Melastoma candidum]|uniref:Uncharacterized protein n=1 Tax=Melastoma candidum TaxID=119954 RepID=A0ACB9RCA8_9MYRT|nr:hypothetical protein MLD38_013307 [Melastoma candidum]
MEDVKKSIWDMAMDVRSRLESSSASLGKKFGEGKGSGISSVLSPHRDPSPLIVTRSSGKVVPLWTCSKLCTVFFVAGVFVGYTLRRRAKRWVSKLLRRLKDD